MRMTAEQAHRAAIASRNFAMDNNDCWGWPRTRPEPDSPRFFDRHLKELKIGQRVLVQYLLGRYGQTGRLTGRIIYINSQYRFLSVQPDDGGPDYEWHDGQYLGKRGSCLYVFDNHRRPEGWPDNHYVGFHEHRDFEHGHEVWVEIL